MSLPEVGHSITDHLLSRGRKTWKTSPLCTRCGEPCYPRGRDGQTGRCWFCRFPRCVHGIIEEANAA